MTEINSPSVGSWNVRIGRRIWPATVSGLGGFLVIYVLAQLSQTLGVLLLVAPFGASCVLVFALPQSPLAQPKNVIGGHLISAFIGIAVYGLLGAHPLSFALAVGLAIAAMQVTGTLHPPAGADPIVVLATGASWSFLVMPMLAGTLLIVAAAYCFHRFISHRSYPG
ncbi:HPP family protein [Rhizobium sp. NPDC090279]|uniref:HPP family protein n=1 Tax=Rhizobium sp. NPDC090279 TaxID=3364499 RepID=UPI00383A6176